MTWTAVLGMALIVLACRTAVPLLLRRPSPRLESLLAPVPLAVLSAVVGPRLFLVDGQWNLGPEVLAAVVTFALAWRGVVPVAAMVIGVLLYWVIEALL